MMYCSVREAYDNPLQKKLEEYQNNNNSYQSDFQSVTPKRLNDSDNNEEIVQEVQNNQNQYNIDNNIVQHPVFVPSFFTAQGDYANQGPYHDNTNNLGTHIDELKDCGLDSDSNIGLDNQSNLDDMFTLDDSLSFLDSNSILPQNNNQVLPQRSDQVLPRNNNQVLPQQLDYLLDKPKSKSKRSHQYYIKKFVKAMIDEAASLDNSIGSSSLESFANYDVYNHVKRCKYCRSEAHKRLRSFYAKENKDDTNIKKEIEGFENNFTIPKDILLGYDLKEIVIIIIIGIILIFILDLFVKIGRKTMNLKNKNQ